MNQPAIRVLLVDDESAIRRALRPPLIELGFQVSDAVRGEEALQMLRTGSYDVVLLDISMPGIGGIETLRRIRAFAPGLPVVMLTVRDGEDEKVEALDLGASDYVTKPFSTRELIARIRAVVRQVKTPGRLDDAPIEIGEIRLEQARRVASVNKYCGLRGSSSIFLRNWRTNVRRYSSSFPYSGPHTDFQQPRVWNRLAGVHHQVMQHLEFLGRQMNRASTLHAPGISPDPARAGHGESARRGWYPEHFFCALPSAIAPSTPAVETAW
jgi:CheY-like chemotaxis protein